MTASVQSDFVLASSIGIMSYLYATFRASTAVASDAILTFASLVSFLSCLFTFRFSYWLFQQFRGTHPLALRSNSFLQVGKTSYSMFNSISSLPETVTSTNILRFLGRRSSIQNICVLLILHRILSDLLQARWLSIRLWSGMPKRQRRAYSEWDIWIWRERYVLFKLFFTADFNHN